MVMKRTWTILSIFLIQNSFAQPLEEAQWIVSSDHFRYYSSITGWHNGTVEALYYDADTIYVSGNFNRVVSSKDTLITAGFAYSTDLINWNTYHAGEPDAIGKAMIKYKDKLYFGGGGYSEILA